MIDEDDEPLGVLLFLVGFVASYHFWDACLFYPTRRKLLDQYDVAGVETTAKVLSQHLTVHRRNFSETHRVLLVQFAYSVPGSEEHVVVKRYSERLPPGTVPPAARSVLVKVLPGYPKSGLPKFQIDRREFDYGSMAASYTAFFTFMLVVGCSFNLLFNPMASFLAFMATCLPIALFNCYAWKNAKLHRCDDEATVHREHSEEPMNRSATFAEATVVPAGDGDDSHIPLATAVPLDVESAIQGSDALLLPDRLAEAILNDSKRCSFPTLIARLDDFRDGKWDARASYVELAAEHWGGEIM